MDSKKEKAVKSFIDKAVSRKKSHEPKFYVVSGSHIYGFPSPTDEGGDIDVRGFHVAEGSSYLTLNPPQEQIEINQGEVTEGFEAHPEIDLVSYELKKFGKLLHKTNYNVIEWLFTDQVIMNGDPLAIDSLRDIIEDALPSDVPRHYRGMAKQNYRKFLNRNKDNYRPTAKKFLYVTRGILAADYVSKKADIEPSVSRLAEELLAPEKEEIVEELIEVKQKSENEMVPDSLRERAHSMITELFRDMEIKTIDNKEMLRREIDDWMLKVRDF